MSAAFYQQLDQTLSRIKADGFWKAERLIGTPQGPEIHMADGREVLNFCANNYLGLADDPRLVDAAIDGMRSHGFGMASVRFICG
ncbi:MAG TPA: glycine C-acetyltransferase, partial [Dongiaceae bacterium]|nr:glycine C-acetyltransferase [Dongiaceae bacterium]